MKESKTHTTKQIKNIDTSIHIESSRRRKAIIAPSLLALLKECEGKPNATRNKRSLIKQANPHHYIFGVRRESNQVIYEEVEHTPVDESPPVYEVSEVGQGLSAGELSHQCAEPQAPSEVAFFRRDLH